MLEVQYKACTVHTYVRVNVAQQRGCGVRGTRTAAHLLGCDTACGAGLVLFMQDMHCTLFMVCYVQ